MTVTRRILTIATLVKRNLARMDRADEVHPIGYEQLRVRVAYRSILPRDTPASTPLAGSNRLPGKSINTRILAAKCLPEGPLMRDVVAAPEHGASTWAHLLSARCCTFAKFGKQVMPSRHG